MIPAVTDELIKGIWDLNLFFVAWVFLSVELLSPLSLAHNYKSGGDVVPDPDMEVTVDFTSETVQAETYQDTYVFREANDKRSRKELNEFLLMWLGNLVDQGHKSVEFPSSQ